MKIIVNSKNIVSDNDIYSILKLFLSDDKPYINKKGFEFTLYRKLSEETIFNGLKDLCKIYNLKTFDRGFIFKNDSENIFEIRLEYETSPENLILVMSFDDFVRIYGHIPEDEPKDHPTDVKELRCPYCGSFKYRSVYVEDVEYFKDKETGEYTEGWEPGTTWACYKCDNCYEKVIF